jgi:Outer membrane efflux protein.
MALLQISRTLLASALMTTSAFGLARVEAERIALQKNLHILSERSERVGARAYSQEIMSAWLPQVFFTWNIKKYQDPIVTESVQQGTYSGALNIDQRLFDLTLMRRYQSALIGLKIADLEVARASIDTLFGVRQRYYAALLESQLEVVRQGKALPSRRGNARDAAAL